ncbi:MAG: chorismate mutase [Thermaurantiacus sp.]|nr:chorismate mutase [Thermaurantiacus sp.]
MTRPRPEATRTLAEVRAAVDSLDRELVALLAERMRFMEAAARIKAARHEVRDDARKREVIANARAEAIAHGLDPDLVGRLWDVLVEASIAHELAAFDRRAGHDSVAKGGVGAWRE